MIEKIWFGQNHSTKYLFFFPILWILSVLFLKVSILRKFFYVNVRKKSYRAPVPVVIVGNITVGGNGKTPVVIWLVKLLQSQGYIPGVVSRGYGGKASTYPLIVEAITPTKICGDEPKLIRQRTGALVAVSPTRSDAAKALLPFGVDIIIADDGLQHYALERDIELSVVDGVRRFGNSKMIPLGPLREPITRLSKVDFVIINGGKAVDNEISMILKADLAVNLRTGKKVSVSQLGELVAFAGIGHPERFFVTLQKLGACLVTTHSFIDHKNFQQKDLDALSEHRFNVIMTEKDAMKCQGFAKHHWWYLPVSAVFCRRDKERILNKIKEVAEYYGPPSS
ncbi:tetraacyldisaccharide 4'-kinase [Candidatus Photodesmus blepharus]|uniref:Tetraacyldisaccharide 4'-kinase n=1 Tax=Candidatus Photodesmus blepharonis TaxID=1179155 RepID=A0A084CMM7_9GAMM|nr:tetraacyldisaccharide 4'-kinase [Candidatus Photodesmus blepharus]KEY91056.1 tetraacyldisaccharide 4'-kinase [Candidatus Photodesmus blepharus]